MYMHVYTCICVYVCICVLACVYVCIRVYVCIYVHVCIICMCVCILCAYVHMWVYTVYIYVCVYVCVGICLCVWMYVHTRLEIMCYNVLGTQLNNRNMTVNKIYPHPFLHRIYNSSEIQFEDLKTNSIWTYSGLSGDHLEAKCCCDVLVPHWHMAVGALASNNGFCLLLINSNEEVSILSSQSQARRQYGEALGTLKAAFGPEEAEASGNLSYFMPFNRTGWANSREPGHSKETNFNTI